MKIADFMDLSKGQGGKSCIVIAGKYKYTGVFMGIITNQECELFMSLKMAPDTMEIFKYVGTIDENRVTDSILIRISSIDEISFCC